MNKTSVSMFTNTPQTLLGASIKDTNKNYMPNAFATPAP